MPMTDKKCISILLPVANWLRVLGQRACSEYSWLLKLLAKTSEDEQWVTMCETGWQTYQTLKVFSDRIINEKIRPTCQFQAPFLKELVFTYVLICDEAKQK